MNSTGGQEVLRGENIVKRFGAVTALNGVSLHLKKGEMMGILGDNGAGKSTMIKVLTGELEPGYGTTWRHPNMRVAYVAQHAFHHIEQVLARPLAASPRWITDEICSSGQRD